MLKVRMDSNRVHTDITSRINCRGYCLSHHEDRFWINSRYAMWQYGKSYGIDLR